jgi:hypothetical protein
VPVADGPRLASLSHVLRVLSCLCFGSVVISSFGWARFRTVRVCRADSPRVPGGQSASSPRTVRYSGSLLEVLFAFSDSLRQQAGQSAWPVRTVRPPGRTVRQSLAALFLGSIPLSFLSCFRVCFKESFLRLEVDRQPCCLGDWCVI